MVSYTWKRVRQNGRCIKVYGTAQDISEREAGRGSIERKCSENKRE